MKQLERQVLKDNERLKHPEELSIMELSECHGRAMAWLRYRLRTERNREERRKIENTILEGKRIERRIRERVDAMLARKISEGREAFFDYVLEGQSEELH